MPIDWVARLDARGYHALPVAREDNVVSWNGSTRVEDGVVVGDAITVADPTDHALQRTLHVGDFIFMSGSRKGQPAEIARIDAFEEDSDKDIAFLAMWFWRPERLGKQLPAAFREDWHERELYLQVGKAADENYAETVELCPVTIHMLEQRPNEAALSSFAEAPHTFFCWRGWNPVTKSVVALPSSSQDEAATGAHTDPDAAPPAAAPPAATARVRRNKQAERLTALEQQVEEQQSQIAELSAKLDSMSSLLQRVAELEEQISLNA